MFFPGENGHSPVIYGLLKLQHGQLWRSEIRNQPRFSTELTTIPKKNMWVHQTSATTSSHGCGFIFPSLPLTSFWCVAKAIKSQPREIRFSSSFDFVTCEPNGSDRVLVTIGVTPIKNQRHAIISPTAVAQLKGQQTCTILANSPLCTHLRCDLGAPVLSMGSWLPQIAALDLGFRSPLRGSCIQTRHESQCHFISCSYGNLLVAACLSHSRAMYGCAQIVCGYNHQHTCSPLPCNSVTATRAIPVPCHHIRFGFS